MKNSTKDISGKAIREKKKQGRIAQMTALLIGIVLLLFGVLNGFGIYYRTLMDLEEHTMNATEAFIPEYYSSFGRAMSMNDDKLSWCMDYWETHSDEMKEIPVFHGDEQLDTEKEWLEEHKPYMEVLSNSPADKLPEFNEKEQRMMAEIAYYQFQECTESVFWNAEADAVICYAPPERDYVTGDREPVFIFSGMPLLPDKDKYMIGDTVPLDLVQHPAVKKILKTKSYSRKVEVIRNDLTGPEYLYAPYPVFLNGKLRCIMAAAVLWSDMKADALRQIWDLEFNSLIYLLLVEIIFLFILRRNVLSPLSMIQSSLQQYMADKDSGEMMNRLSDVSRMNNEIGSLSGDIVDMSQEIDRYVNEIRSLAEERSMITAELNISASIQSDALPKFTPEYTERSEFKIYADMTPAFEVGGDFYDFYLIDDDHLALIIADVSDKGIPAALFMMVSKTMLKAISKLKGLSHPKEIFQIANNMLAEKNKSFMFVTVWMGILTISTGEIACANAGHEKPAIFRASGEGGAFSIHESVHSAILGVLPNRSFIEDDLILKPNDVLFVYTDGVTDAAASDQSMFGEERLLAALNESADTNPESVISRVHQRINEFVGDNEQFDDITMLCLKYYG